MFYHNYVIQSQKNGNLYTGHAVDLKKRLKEHNQGLNKSTIFKNKSRSKIIKTKTKRTFLQIKEMIQNSSTGYG